MKKILIATRNRDKFKIVSKLLSTEEFKDYNFYSLNDIDDTIVDKKVTGDIINRSFEKAKNTFESIKNNDYEYIVGVDDGIKIKGEILENVKDYIKPIINDELLKKDEIVYIVRAYTFYNKTGKYHSILTKIPFKYKKVLEGFKIEENSYPLSHVFCAIEYDKPVIALNEEESNEYYYNYSKDKYIEVKDFFNDK